MPRSVARDAQGRTFDEYVADQVMAAILGNGETVRSVAVDAGINRETLRRRLHNTLPFNTRELALVAEVLDLSPSDLTVGFKPA